MPRYIDADIAIREATQEGAHGYISAEEIDKIPTANVRENVKGEWKLTEEYIGYVAECSACHDTFCLIEGTPTDYHYNFCPNCGADMRGGEDGNNS